MGKKKLTKKTISERINVSFKEGDRENLSTYIGWLREAMSEYRQGLRRTVALAILLMAIFGLVAQAPATAITVASLKISKHSLVFELLPAFIAYLYLQVAIESNRASRVRETYMDAFDKWLPTNKETEIHFLAEPPQPPYWSFSEYSLPVNVSRADTADVRVTVLLVILLTLGGLFFEFLAYFYLYNHQFPVNPVLFIASATVTFLCAVAAAVNFSYMR
jgi:hypothetical protein